MAAVMPPFPRRDSGRRRGRALAPRPPRAATVKGGTIAATGARDDALRPRITISPAPSHGAAAKVEDRTELAAERGPSVALLEDGARRAFEVRGLEDCGLRWCRE